MGTHQAQHSGLKGSVSNLISDQPGALLGKPGLKAEGTNYSTFCQGWGEWESFRSLWLMGGGNSGASVLFLVVKYLK